MTRRIVFYGNCHLQQCADIFNVLIKNNIISDVELLHPNISVEQQHHGSFFISNKLNHQLKTSGYEPYITSLHDAVSMCDTLFYQSIGHELFPRDIHTSSLLQKFSCEAVRVPNYRFQPYDIIHPIIKYFLRRGIKPQAIYNTIIGDLVSSDLQYVSDKIFADRKKAIQRTQEQENAKDQYRGSLLVDGDDILKHYTKKYLSRSNDHQHPSCYYIADICYRMLQYLNIHVDYTHVEQIAKQKIPFKWSHFYNPFQFSYFRRIYPVLDNPEHDNFTRKITSLNFRETGLDYIRTLQK